MKNTTFTKIGSGVIGLAFLASAVPAFADTSTTTATSTQGTYNTTCVQSAVGVHEDVNTAALNTYNTAVSAALSVRKTELVAAWAQTNFTVRLEALKAAIMKYRAAVKTAAMNYKTARMNSALTFETSMKACGVTKADFVGQNNIEKKEGKTGFNLGLGADFGLHFGKNKKDKSNESHDDNNN